MNWTAANKVQLGINVYCKEVVIDRKGAVCLEVDFVKQFSTELVCYADWLMNLRNSQLALM